MQDIQEVFNRLRDNKRKQKELKEIYKDALKNSLEYQNTLTSLKALREKKKQIEGAIQSGMASEFAELDRLAADAAADILLLSDAALTKMMKGERVEVQDEFNNVYDPVFTVKFKKARN